MAEFSAEVPVEHQNTPETNKTIGMLNEAGAGVLTVVQNEPGISPQGSRNLKPFFP